MSCRKEVNKGDYGEDAGIEILTGKWTEKMCRPVFADEDSPTFPLFLFRRSRRNAQ